MVCIHCGSGTKVTNSRLQIRSNQVWRRRSCSACGAIFTTEEATKYSDNWIVTNSRTQSKSAFSRDKLFLSIYKSCQHRKNALNDASYLTANVTSRLLETIKDSALDNKLIGQIVQVALSRFDKAASVHYEAFHDSTL